MDSQRFDDLTRGLTEVASRRTVLRGLLGAALGGLLAQMGIEDAGAAFADCRALSKRCSRDNQCCTGRCKRGRCTCPMGTTKNPTGGGCTATGGVCPSGRGGNSCGTFVSCGAFDDNGTPRTCACFLDANGNPFCGTNQTPPGTGCDDCTTNDDCDPGFACVKLSAPSCGCGEVGGRTCMAACLAMW